MTLNQGLRMGAGLFLILGPVATRADGHHAEDAAAAEVEPGFPPSDSQDNAPPPEFSIGGDRDEAGGAASGEPDATAPKDGEDSGMPPTDSEDAVPPAAAPTGTGGQR